MILQHRRRGVTLTEALVAIFIMAVGLLSLLALFPVGAISMARAVRDDRCAQAAANADNLARILWRTAWLDPVTGSVVPEATALQREPALNALDNPTRFGPAAGGNPQLNIPPDATTPSWSVYIDPIGCNTFLPAIPPNPQWIANLPAQVAANSAANNVPGVVRRPIAPNFLPATSPDRRIRMCSVGDDIGFSRGGDSISSSGTGQVDRGGRYNWSWLIQRLKNNVRNEVNLHVIVYEGRPPADVALNEGWFQIEPPQNTTPPFPNNLSLISPGVSQVTIIKAGQTPRVRRGGWVMIAGLAVKNPLTSTPTPVPITELYRVTAITDVPNFPDKLQLELATPVRVTVTPQTVVNASPAPATQPFTYAARLFVMEGVVEVFDRGTISPTAPPAP